MKRGTVGNKGRVKRWARGIGKLTAETEIAIMKSKADFEAKVRRLRGREQKILKKLAAQHLANHRALNEFRAGIRRASAELKDVYRSAVRQFRSRNSQKSMRVTTYRK